MRKCIKRIAAAASAVVIGGVSCVTTWFSVPASAAGGFAWLEWAEFESLLQGVGFSSGGGYKNVQEATLDWLNMTSDQFYKLTDPTDGGNAKPIWEQSWWGDMTDWLDNVVHSWSEDYSGIADVGADVSGVSSPFFIGSDGHSLSLDSIYSLSDNTLFPFGDYCFSYQPFSFSGSWATPASYQQALTSAHKILVFLKDTVWICTVFVSVDDFSLVNYNNVNNGRFGVFQYVNGSTGGGTASLPLVHNAEKVLLLQQV